ncbi:MAG: hypothetical protein OJF61_000010 [Rhodanobacteraceae bacterium]|nr:MAG: hypothetical protein OJF61_000010 [Rhodanobacteraceae bacterium]
MHAFFGEAGSRAGGRHALLRKPRNARQPGREIGPEVYRGFVTYFEPNSVLKSDHLRQKVT